MKKGQELYEVWADEKGEINWSIYIIRSIRKKIVYATLKASWTWGKRSKKHGDYGFLDPVAAEWRHSWYINREPYGDIATTRIGALKKAILSHNKHAEPDDFENPEIYDEVKRKLKILLKKEQNKRKDKLTYN